MEYVHPSSRRHRPAGVSADMAALTVSRGRRVNRLHSAVSRCPVDGCQFDPVPEKIDPGVGRDWAVNQVQLSKVPPPWVAFWGWLVPTKKEAGWGLGAVTAFGKRKHLENP